MHDWNAIVAAHGPIVWRTVYRLLGRDADAHDCYQETFLAAYRSAGRRRVEHWPAFLTSLATRRAIDRLRQRGRADRQLGALDDAPEPVDPGGSAIEFVLGAECLAEVRRALAALPPKQAEVFWLSGVEGMAHRDIAEHLRITDGAVRVLLHRARGRLQAALRERQPDAREDR